MAGMESGPSRTGLYYWLSIATLVLGLYLTTWVNYLLFHTLVELFSIIVAATVFIITWNSAKYIKNQYLITMGISYLFVGSLDLLHTLAYKGMPIFTDYDYYANQLWIAARFLESCTLLLAFLLLFTDREVKPALVFASYTCVTSLLVASIFYWKIFPVCFIAGQGLTSFKVYSEYLICAILVASIVLLSRNRTFFAEQVYRWLMLSMVFAIITELSFTFYVDNYGLSNLVGHYFKLFSFMMIYRAIVATGIEGPYRLIFKDLHQTNENLRTEIALRIEFQDKLESEINERRLAEVALKEREFFFKESQRAASVGSYKTDLVTGQWESSEIMDKIFGIDEKYPRSIQGWLDIVHPEDREAMARYLNDEVVGKGARFSKEYRIVRPVDGVTRWVHGLGEVVSDEKGGLLTLTGTIQDITERKLADEALRASEEFNMAVLDTMGGLVVVLDMEGRIRRFNLACEAATGYDGAEVTGRIFWEFLVPQEDLEGVRLTWARLRAGNFPNCHENHWVAKDGTRSQVAWTNTAITDARGELLYVVATGLDVTARKRAEESLRENELRFRLATETTGVGIWEWNVKTNKIRWDAQMFRLYGIAPTPDGFVRYSDWSAAVLPEDLPEQEAILHQTSLRGGQSSREFRLMRCGDGACRYIQAVETVRINELGEIEWVVGTNLDITERKQAEEALRKSEKRFRLALKNSPVSVAIQDRNLVYQWAYNQKSRRPEEIVGKTDADLFAPEEVAWINEVKQRVLESGAEEHVEQWVTSNGRRMFLDLTYEPLRDEAGEITGIGIAVVDLTRQKLAEELLQESESRLRLAQETANVGIWDWQVVTGALDFTPELNTLYGLPAGTIKTYQDWRDRVHPDDIHATEVLRDAAIAQHEPFDLEFRGLHSSGEYRWISTKGGAIYNEAGETLRVLGVNIDITGRKQSEAALKESELRFRTLTNAMPQLAWIARADGYIFWYNQRWYDYTGTVPEQMEGWGWQRVHDVDELPKVLERWQASIATGEPFEMTFPLLGADGIFRKFLTRVIPLKDDAGRILQWFGTNTDVDELKRVEKALSESEAMYRGIGESIDYGVWACAPDGRNIYASQSFLEMVGITQQECSDFGWGDVLHPDDAPRTIAAWQECVRTGGTWDIEHRFRGTDGQWHHVLARGVPVRNEQGEIIRWAGINLDISQLKKAEQQITAQLAEKDVMLREIHHRVKNNLQVISSLVSLQADSLSDERMRVVFGDVRDRVRSMALVHEKLYQTGDLAHLDFADYARSLMQYLWRSHGALSEKVRLDLAIAPVALPIEAAVPCGLILNELAGNALKHGFPGAGDGQVTVGLSQDAETLQVCLMVRDDGVGLPAGLDWRQASSLGLRLVQMLAGQLRGTVETGSGPGAEFKVIFSMKGFAHD